MTLDSEKHRQIILELIRAANIPGSAIDDIFDLKRSVIAARVEGDDDRTSHEQN